MKFKYTKRSIANAQRLLKKYADIDANTMKDSIAESIKTAIINASSAPIHGIMPFTQELTKDNATLGLTIIRSNGLFNSKIEVLPASVNPSELANKYAGLAPQVSAYLNKYSELFPSKINGTDISYNNFRIDLVFGQTQIATGNRNHLWTTETPTLIPSATDSDLKGLTLDTNTYSKQVGPAARASRRR